MSAPPATPLPSSLSSLFLFNPLLGNEDTESRKILYFYPPSTPLNRQKDLVGLCEGLINFTREFSPHQPIESLSSNKLKFACFECEKDYWFILVVENPRLIGQEGKGEYFSEELDDSVLQAILRRAYHTFRLFNNTFESFVSSHGGLYDPLRVRLDLYMRYFLPTVRFHQLPFFTDIYGFQFLPVDKTTFLSIQYILNLLSLQFSRVKAAALLFNGKLLWSGLGQDDMFLLYNLDQEIMAQFFSYMAINEQIDSPVSVSPCLSTYEKFGVKKKRSHTQNEEEEEEEPEAEYDWSEEKCREYGVDYLTPSSGANGANDKTRRFNPQSVAAALGLRRNTQTTQQTTANTTASAAAPSAASPLNAAGGFLTGPFRLPAPNPNPPASAPPTPLQSPAWQTPLPFSLIDKPSPNSPRIFLSSDLSDVTRFGPSAAGGPVSRLVVYQRYKITLFLIVNDQDDTQTETTTATSTPADPTATRPPSMSVSLDGHPSTASSDPFFDSSAASPRAASASVSAPPSLSSSTLLSSSPPGTVYRPPIPFYESLEQFLHGHLTKLSAMLADQATRQAATAANAEENFRFLYFNHMNLALKTSLHGRTQPLTMETIKIVREIHQEFNAINVRDSRIIEATIPRIGETMEERCGPRTVAPSVHDARNSISYNNAAQHSNANSGVSIHSGISLVQPGHALSAGSSEICVRSRGSGWIIGKRLNDSHRELYLLLDDKAGHIGEIQGEIDALCAQLFQNIFLH